MLTEYFIDDLIVGNLYTIQSMGGNICTLQTQQGPFIFKKMDTKPGKKQKYQEVFTEDVYKESNGRSNQKFGKTYVIKIDDIKNYLSDEDLKKKTISKKKVLNVYNKIRERKTIEDYQENTKSEEMYTSGRQLTR